MNPTQLPRTELAASRENWFQKSIALRIHRTALVDSVPQVAVLEPMQFRVLSTQEEMAVENEPCLRLSPDDAQQWMDELWRCGVRPSEGTGSTGQLAATQKHLDDMRAIAMHKLGMAGGGKAKGERLKAKGKRQKAKGKRQKAKGKRQKAKG